MAKGTRRTKQVKLETIAVTAMQYKRLKAAATAHAKKAKLPLRTCFRPVRGTVPPRTMSDTACRNHRLVTVMASLRREVIKHKSMGRVRLGTSALQRLHPRGVACYMHPPLGGDTRRRPSHGMPRRSLHMPQGHEQTSINRTGRLLQRAMRNEDAIIEALLDHETSETADDLNSHNKYDAPYGRPVPHDRVREFAAYERRTKRLEARVDSANARVMQLETVLVVQQEHARTAQQALDGA